MGFLRDLLGAAASEASLRSMLGRWRVEVSERIDSLQASADALVAAFGGTAGNPFATLDVLETQRTGANQTVAAGDDVILQGTQFNQGAIAYDPATGIYTLGVGKLYELDAYLAFINYDSGAELQVNWVQADTNAFLSESLLGIYAPDDGAQSIASDPGPHMVYLPGTAAEARVKLRVVGGAATADVQSFASGAIIKQLR